MFKFISYVRSELFQGIFITVYQLFISDNGEIYIFIFLSAEMQLFQANRNRTNFVRNFTTYCY